jgi:hypothetical protein
MPTKVSCLLLPLQALLISQCVLLSSPFKFLIGLSMADEDSLSVAGATQIPTSASVLASLTGVVDQHIRNVKSAEMNFFLGELCNVLGN